MNVSARSLFVTAFAAALAALHACGGDKDPVSEAPPASTSAPSGDQKPVAPGTASADASVDASVASPPAHRCAFFEDHEELTPNIAPSCRACAVKKCCVPVTICFGAPRDAGPPGADGGGGESACVLFGECEERCAEETDGGEPLNACEEACRATYGDKAANAWMAAADCLYDPPPTGCGCP